MPGVGRQVQGVEARAPLGERRAQQRLDLLALARAECQGIEGDVDDGRLLLQLTARVLAAQPRLELNERQRHAVAEGEQLAVEDAVPGKAMGGRDYLRIALADLVEVAAEDTHLAALLVQLGANAVVLVLDPDRCAEPAQDFRLVGNRVGEHRLQRPEHRQLGSAKALVACQLGGVTQVAGQHAGHLDVGQLGIERGRYGRLEMALAESDAHVAREDLDHRARHGRVAARQQRGQRSRLRGGPARLGHLGERLGDLGQRRLVLRRGRVAVRREEVVDGPTQVGRFVVSRAQRSRLGVDEPFRHAGNPRPADPGSPRVAFRERPAGHVAHGQRQLIGRERAQILGQRGHLFAGPRRGGDLGGRLAPMSHRERW